MRILMVQPCEFAILSYRRVSTTSGLEETAYCITTSSLLLLVLCLEPAEPLDSSSSGGGTGEQWMTLNRPAGRLEILPKSLSATFPVRCTQPTPESLSCLLISTLDFQPEGIGKIHCCNHMTNRRNHKCFQKGQKQPRTPTSTISILNPKIRTIANKYLLKDIDPNQHMLLVNAAKQTTASFRHTILPTIPKKC